MFKWFPALDEPIKSAGSLVEKKLMRDFAHKFGLVYFGTMRAQSDEYEIVRGVTLHTNHHDNHFIIGNYHNYDITALQRHVTLSHPQHGVTRYKWSLVQIDLHRRRMPHILITSRQNDAIFLDNLKIKLANFQKLRAELIPHQAFAHHFEVFTATENLDQVPTILTPEVMSAMIQYFKNFDVEMFDDQVIVYAGNLRLSMSILQDMLREGLWLAGQLDAAAEHEAIPQA